MKNITFTIPYDEEKISALKMFLEKKSLKLEDELKATVDRLYEKQVPATVREYITDKAKIENGQVSKK